MMRIDEGGPNLWITHQAAESIVDCLVRSREQSLGTSGGWIVHGSSPSLEKTSCSQSAPRLSPKDLYKCIEIASHVGIK